MVSLRKNCVHCLLCLIYMLVILSVKDLKIMLTNKNLTIVAATRMDDEAMLEEHVA